MRERETESENEKEKCHIVFGQWSPFHFCARCVCVIVFAVTKNDILK